MRDHHIDRASLKHVRPPALIPGAVGRYLRAATRCRIVALEAGY